MQQTIKEDIIFMMKFKMDCNASNVQQVIQLWAIVTRDHFMSSAKPEFGS